MSVIVKTVNQEVLDRAAALLTGIDGGMEKAIKSAMSRAVSGLRSNTVKAIREQYAISAAAIRANENVTVRYTRQDGLQAFIRFAGHKIPLYRYDGARPIEPTPDTGRLIRAQIHGKWLQVHPSVPTYGHQLKNTAPALFEDAFVARMGSGHTGMFERDGTGKVKEFMGSSVPQMLGGEEVEEKLSDEAMKKFEERLSHEVMALMNGWRT